MKLMDYKYMFGLVILIYCSTGSAANLSLPNGGRVFVELISSEAAFRNTLAMVSPTNVAISVTGCTLEPADNLSELKLLSEKDSQHGCRVELDADATTPEVDAFPPNTVLQFEFCAKTSPGPNCTYLWSSNPASNSDGFDHLRTVELTPGFDYRLEWEDLPNGGDLDFNDLVAVIRTKPDTDGDGLWDDWETTGIDTDGDGLIDLTLPGADPNTKDVYLEIDYFDCAVGGGDCVTGDSHTHMPNSDVLTAMQDAFADAGITLHIDLDSAVSHHHFMTLGCGGIAPSSEIVDYDVIKAANFSADRRFAYHYMVFGHRQAPASSLSGCAELPGNDSIVTLGDWNTQCILGGGDGLQSVPQGDDIQIDQDIYSGPNLQCNTPVAAGDTGLVPFGSPVVGDGLMVGTPQQQAGTAMHELGHNMNLCHGGSMGQCNVDRKPNYISIMNRSFQTDGIGPFDGVGTLTAEIDFSSTVLDPLDENNNLNENLGIGTVVNITRYFCSGDIHESVLPGPEIDWNCINGIESSVTADINNDTNFSVLEGYDDWSNLKYDFHNSGNYEEGVHSTVALVDEIDFPSAQRIPKTIGIDVKPGSDTNPINPSSRGKIPVAILSNSVFDAPASILQPSLTFGSTGNEKSLTSCEVDDVNDDGALDLLCHFSTVLSNFSTDSTQARIRGMFRTGKTFSGSDSIRIVPKKRRKAKNEKEHDKWYANHEHKRDRDLNRRWRRNK